MTLRRTPPFCGAITRRDAIGRLALLPASIPLWVQPRKGSAPIWILVAGVHEEDAAHGIELGGAEAVRAGDLVGREIRIVHAGAAVPDRPAGVIAPAAPDGTYGDNVPIVSLSGATSPAAPCLFQVSATDAQKEQALTRWRASRPDTPSSAAVLEWHASLSKFGAAELNDRYERAFGKPMAPAAWLGWFAVKALSEMALRQRGTPPCEALASARIDGHKGRALSFDPSRVLIQPLYIVADGRVLGETA